VSQATIQGNCERIFKDYATLRMHMKKKRHFKVNGRNKIYDQFYLINYLEWGKTWEDLQREPDDDGESEATISTISEIDPWRDWEETIDESDMLEEPTKCAVCDERCVNAALALTHLVEEHDLDLIKLRAEWQLDVYATIKLINYLRWCYSVAHKCPRCALQCADSASLHAHVKAEQPSARCARRGVLGRRAVSDSGCRQRSAAARARSVCQRRRVVRGRGGADCGASGSDGSTRRIHGAIACIWIEQQI
jgi:hypothetical protein